MNLGHRGLECCFEVMYLYVGSVLDVGSVLKICMCLLGIVISIIIIMCMLCFVLFCECVVVVVFSPLFFPFLEFIKCVFRLKYLCCG